MKTLIATAVAAPSPFDAMTLEEAWELHSGRYTWCVCSLYGCYCLTRSGRCCQGDYKHAVKMMSKASELARAMQQVANRTTVKIDLGVKPMPYVSCTMCGNPPPCSHVVIGKKAVTVDREEWNNIQAELLALRRYKDTKEMEEMRRQQFTGRVTTLGSSTVMFDNYPYSQTFKIQPNM